MAAGCEEEVGYAVSWFGEQLFDANEQQRIFTEKLKVCFSTSARVATIKNTYGAQLGLCLRGGLQAGPERATHSLVTAGPAH